MQRSARSRAYVLLRCVPDVLLNSRRTTVLARIGVLITHATGEPAGRGMGFACHGWCGHGVFSVGAGVVGAIRLQIDDGWSGIPISTSAERVGTKHVRANTSSRSGIAIGSGNEIGDSSHSDGGAALPAAGAMTSHFTMERTAIPLGFNDGR